MKYQKWHIGTAAEGDTALLREAGYSGLLATVLASRGITTAKAAGDHADSIPHADAGYGQGCGPDSKGPCQ